MSDGPAELMAALEVLKRPPKYGDQQQIEAKRTAAKYKRADCGHCNGTGRCDWWVAGKGHAGTTEGPCDRCSATGKVWKQR